MDFLEGLTRAFDGCFGLLEVLTIFLDAVAVYLGVKTYQKDRHVAEKLSHQHGKTPIKKPSWWPFAILLVLALAFTALTVFKWARLAR
jgi:hypothetical protein